MPASISSVSSRRALDMLRPMTAVCLWTLLILISSPRRLWKETEIEKQDNHTDKQQTQLTKVRQSCLLQCVHTCLPIFTFPLDTVLVGGGGGGGGEGIHEECSMSPGTMVWTNRIQGQLECTMVSPQCKSKAIAWWYNLHHLSMQCLSNGTILFPVERRSFSSALSSLQARQSKQIINFFGKSHSLSW